MGNDRRTRKGSHEYALVPPPEASHPSEDNAPELDVDDPSLSLDADVAPDDLGPPARPRRRRDSMELIPSLPGSWPRFEAPPEPAPIASTNPALRELRDCYAAGNFSDALLLAERILAHDPEDPDAHRYADSCRRTLTQMFSARLGPLDQVPGVALRREEVRWLSLDHRAGFLLSLVDGTSTIEQILDSSGMPRLDALRILYALLEQRVIAIGKARPAR